MTERPASRRWAQARAKFDALAANVVQRAERPLGALERFLARFARPSFVNAELEANRARSRALPMFGDGEVPLERYRHLTSDATGFRGVLFLLLRSWPYIRPRFLGQWWYPQAGIKNSTAELSGSDGYRSYAPLLVTIVAVAGPLFGWTEATLDWPMNLLYAPVAAIVVGTFLMNYGRGPWQGVGIVAVLLSAIGAMLTGVFLIDLYTTGPYVLVVLGSCVFGWLVQFRVQDGRLDIRVRSRTHLVYFYAINFFERFLDLALGVVLADLLNQSLLQAEPLAPGLAALLGYPDLAAGTAEQLTQAERHELKWAYVYVALGTHLCRLPLRIFNPYYNMWILQSINQDLRLDLLSRWHQLSLSYHASHRTGDSIYRLYQDSAMVTAVVGHLTGMTLAMMSYYSCVVLVTLLSPWLGLIAAVLVAPALLWAQWAMPRMRARTLVYRAATSDVTSTVQEGFGAIRLIKAFGAAGRAQRRLEEDSVIAFNAAYRVRALIAVVTIVMYTVAATFMAGGTFLTAVWANRGDPTFAIDLIGLLGLSWVVWNLASFTWTRDQLHESSGDIRKLLRDWMTAQDMAVGLRRVFDILDIEPDVTDRANAMPLTNFHREIRYHDVRFAYEADRPVLDGVSFAVAPGTITAIIGPTGAGKSTVTALLLRLFDPTSGAITIDGKDLRDYQVQSVRDNVTIALQENVLFAMSVRDNIRYAAPTASDEEVREAVRVAAMDDYVAGLPQGLDTVLSDRGGKLSTGQRQRLSIARAVVRDTPILVLDEPTAALDAATEHRVMQNLAQWGEGRAIFVITHRISTIRRADNILYLDAGRIAESGTHDALMQREDGRYRAFVEAESNLTSGRRLAGAA